MQSYVIKSWRVASEPDESGAYIDIKGRAPGLLSWFFSLMGIEPTVTLRVTAREFMMESGSWSGRIVNYVPLAKVSSIVHGFTKPWKEALIMLVVFIALAAGSAQAGGGGVAAGLFLIGIISSVLFYILNKKLTVAVFEVGGAISGLQIKRSVIEGKRLDQADAEQASGIITWLVANKNQ